MATTPQPPSTTAVTATGLSAVAQVAAGWYHSAAIKTDGTGWAWGRNSVGGLGDGTTTERHVPTVMSAVSDLVEIAVGGDLDAGHGVAVTSVGVVWAWGRNWTGQLGDGTTNTAVTPIAISGPNYAWNVATPTFNVSGGSYFVDQTVFVSCATPGATIHYTTDGSTPTEASPTVASGSSLTVNRTMTLQARAWKTGFPTSNTNSVSYTMVVATATPSPGGGTFSTPITESITSQTPNAVIHYTLDGTTPTPSSPVYTGPFTLSTRPSAEPWSKICR